VVLPVCKLGSEGEPVRLIEAALGVEVTGIFDDELDASVKALQTERGLTVDGIVGAKTWPVILELWR
jgi:peptidoglycan hydrolase-like protein with peptidoglycan-binding domain